MNKITKNIFIGLSVATAIALPTTAIVISAKNDDVKPYSDITREKLKTNSNLKYMVQIMQQSH